MQEEDAIRKLLKKEEANRKILYAENELVLFKRDYKINAIKSIFELAKKYDMSADDIQTFMEAAPFL